jgi:hypothetical protein
MYWKCYATEGKFSAMYSNDSNVVQTVVTQQFLMNWEWYWHYLLRGPNVMYGYWYWADVNKNWGNVFIFRKVLKILEISFSSFRWGLVTLIYILLCGFNLYLARLACQTHCLPMRATLRWGTSAGIISGQRYRTFENVQISKIFVTSNIFEFTKRLKF